MKYFQAHDNCYMKSLKMIILAPSIENIDNKRTEIYENGDTVTRTIREWAIKMVAKSTGKVACYDLVNGGKDMVAALLVQGHLYKEVQAEVAEYKLCINPMARREARFCKSTKRYRRRLIVLKSYHRRKFGKENLRQPGNRLQQGTRLDVSRTTGGETP
jgi:hypothetical protein